MPSENENLEKRLMRFAMEHINRYVRKWVSKEKAYCLTLDRHSSIDGWDCLEYCNSGSCALVQGPSNTSHVFHPCDKLINKSFKRSMRKAWDSLCTMNIVDTRTVKSS